MKTVNKKSFSRDLKKITDTALKTEIRQIVEAVKNVTTLQGIPELKKIKGSKTSYRIKVGGNYRIGVDIVGDTVTFRACKPRKDIYKLFP
jgi:mRNA-degrading endonuclease RelE of RelBE toxin-antitoxin system